MNALLAKGGTRRRKGAKASAVAKDDVIESSVSRSLGANGLYEAAMRTRVDFASVLLTLVIYFLLGQFFAICGKAGAEEHPCRALVLSVVATTRLSGTGSVQQSSRSPKKRRLRSQ